MKNTSYLVGTGLCVFHIDATSPAAAIEQLKANIRARKDVKRHPTIGMSLVKALEEGRLNFVVFDNPRTRILAGELHGQFNADTTDLDFRRRLRDALEYIIPDACVFQHPAGSDIEVCE